MTLNLIETLKTSTCSPEHSNNMKIHVHFLNVQKSKKKTHIVETKKLKEKIAFHFYLYCIIYTVC